MFHESRILGSVANMSNGMLYSSMKVRKEEDANA